MKKWKKQTMAVLMGASLLMSCPMTIYADTQTQQTTEVSEEAIAQFYENSVFIGDSVMEDFQLYCMRRPGTWLSNLGFLAIMNYSSYNALRPVTGKSVHPIWKGAKRQVWESIGMIQPKRVFIMLGLNDLDIGGPQATCDRMRDLLGRIQNTAPKAQINIISMTHMAKGTGSGTYFHNPYVDQYNALLCALAQECGWGYMDLCTPLSDEEGNLKACYASRDGYHHTAPAFEVWCDVLRNYAKTSLEASK